MHPLTPSYSAPCCFVLFSFVVSEPGIRFLRPLLCWLCLTNSWNYVFITFENSILVLSPFRIIMFCCSFRLKAHLFPTAPFRLLRTGSAGPMLLLPKCILDDYLQWKTQVTLQENTTCTEPVSLGPKLHTGSEVKGRFAHVHAAVLIKVWAQWAL